MRKWNHDQTLHTHRNVHTRPCRGCPAELRADPRIDRHRNAGLPTGRRRASGAVSGIRLAAHALRVDRLRVPASARRLGGLAVRRASARVRGSARCGRAVLRAVLLTVLRALRAVLRAAWTVAWVRL